MDALAALNFGIVVSLNIRALGIDDDQEVMSTSMKAGCLAGLILAVIYIMLTLLGTSLSGMPIGANGAQTLTHGRHFAVWQKRPLGHGFDLPVSLYDDLRRLVNQLAANSFLR